MPRPPRDEEREQRIAMEIIVDAYSADEQAMGWYVYLEQLLQFRFLATCIVQRAISPLRVGDEVEITGMAPENECEHEMFVLTRWDRGDLAVPPIPVGRPGRGRADASGKPRLALLGGAWS